MWSDVLEKIERLRSCDRSFLVVGAKQHRYRFRPRADAAAMRVAEDRLGVALPPEVKAIYLELGNGGVGPDWGLRPAESIKGFRPCETWPGCTHYNAPGVQLSDANMRGLVGVMDRYYDHISCIVT